MAQIREILKIDTYFLHKFNSPPIFSSFSKKVTMHTSSNVNRLESVLKSSLQGYARILAEEQRLLQEKLQIYAAITNSSIEHRNEVGDNFELSMGIESAVNKLTEDLIASTKNLKRSFDILHGTFGRYLVANKESKFDEVPDHAVDLTNINLDDLFGDAFHTPEADPEPEIENAFQTESTKNNAETGKNALPAQPKKPRKSHTGKQKTVTEEDIANVMLEEMGKGARKSVALNFAATVGYLIMNGPSSGDALMNAVGVSQQTFGTNMRRLREMGWVSTEGKARGMRYTATAEARQKIEFLAR